MSSEAEPLYIPELTDEKQTWKLMKLTGMTIFIPNKIQDQLEKRLKEEE